MVQRLTSLNDITRRIELQAEDFPEGDNPLAPVRKRKEEKTREMAA
jgi:hypothetical protein